MDYAKLEAKLDRIDRKLSELLKDKKQQKSTWVKVSIIQAATGWDRREMQKARQNGLVQFRKDKEGCYEYLLESLQPISVNKQTA